MEEKYANAIEWIMAVSDDTSGNVEKNIDQLQSLISEIEMLIEAHQETMEN